MNTIALPKSAYSEILKRQERADAAIAKLQEQINELSQDELKPHVAARIERRSKSLDAGKGKRFKNMSEVRSYLRAL
jgi:hypothetical protein